MGPKMESKWNTNPEKESPELSLELLNALAIQYSKRGHGELCETPGTAQDGPGRPRTARDAPGRPETAWAAGLAALKKGKSLALILDKGSQES